MRINHNAPSTDDGTRTHKAANRQILNLMRFPNFATSAYFSSTAILTIAHIISIGLHTIL